MSYENTVQPFHRRYTIHDKIGEGGMGAVYRGYDRLTKQPVALKRVTAPTEHLSFSMRDSMGDHNLRLALAREFKTLASLRHPHIISVLDYGFSSDQQPYVAMQLLENATDIVQTGKDQPSEGAVRLLIQLLQAIAYLHRHGILHRDLKPGNILVVDNQVKVLDFGLAIAREQVREGISAGTLAYMAPEVIQGDAPTEAADLYAVGVIAYEMFAGRRPFDMTDLTQFVFDVLSTEPDMSLLRGIVGNGMLKQEDGSLATMLEPASLTQVVQKLLAKLPEKRYQHANEVIKALSIAVGQPIPDESGAIRESFLQAAKFVGREPQIAQLSEVLKAAAAGRGSVWLIGGESGVGKSRLMDELRTLALVQGVHFVRGQAVSEGGAPFLIWHDVLRWLALQTDLTDEEASILKLFISDVEDFHSGEIPDPPPLDPQQMPVRLFHTIRDLLRRQTSPLLILFEDLQWEGTESIEMLKRINAIVPELPLLVVGNYRNDERSDLPTLVPDAHHLKLERLGQEAISELSISMLGSAGRRQELITLLEKETEGNAFFVVEVVRALAEQAGQLDNIALVSLPAHVFAGGMQEIVRRRLNSVPAWGQALIKRAAVAGRQLDLRILDKMARRCESEQADSNAVADGASQKNAFLEKWLSTCAHAATIEAIDGKWRFVHDKLREYILSHLEQDESLTLHQEVAETIEQVYPENPDYAANLAFLWNVVGNRDKELQYLRTAGMHSVRSGANVAAATHFSRALEVLKQHPESPERDQQELELQISLGAPLVVTKGMPSPVTGAVYLRAYALCQQIGQTPLIVPTLFGLTQFNIGQNKLRRASELAHQVVSLARKIQEPNLMIAAMWIAGVCTIQRGELAESRALYEEAMSLYDTTAHQAHLAHFGQDFGVSSRIWSARPIWLMGYPDLAAQRLDDGLALAEKFAHPFTLLLAHLIVGFVRQYRREVQLTLEQSSAAIALSREYEVPQMLGAAQVLHGWALAQQGQAEQGINEMREGVATWEKTGGKVEVSYYNTLLAEALLGAGKPEQGVHLLDEAMSLVQESEERFWESEIYRVRGDFLLTQGNDKAVAEKHYQDALISARRIGAKSLELRASVSLARLWRLQNKRKEAYTLLNPIFGWFTDGLDTVDLSEAKELLGELAV